ncbi:MAG: cobalamin biosynthesis protein [Lachnospiraceae bacterium]|nr:cobalamin biosynthesis protein [Lachnospiraceae bacterium]
MIVRVCAFTREGWDFAHKLEEKLEHILFEKKEENKDLDLWVGECFQWGVPILFIGAISIAVRKIAPFVNSKLTDSPVVVVDEKGQYSIPLLSNHVGGANGLAKQIANAVDGQLVLTTATDVKGVFSVDVFAQKNGLKIVNKEGIKKVSSKLLAEGKISMAIHPTIAFDEKAVPENIKLMDFQENHVDVRIDYPGLESAEEETLKLLYKPYVLGIGCKKETPYEKISSFIDEILVGNQIDESLITGMASIDLKSKERGLLYYEAKKRIPFTTFTAKELEEVEGDFRASDFVKSITGVSNVCERAAMKLAGKEAELVVRKIAKDGITMAISRRKAKLQAWKM